MLFSHGSLSFFPTVRYFYTAMNLSANFILSISTSRSIIGWETYAKVCVVVMRLCPSIFESVSSDTPFIRQIVVA